MSYADAAHAHGRKQQQTDEEKMPHQVPEIAHEDSAVHSLDSLSSSNNAVPSYADQQLAEEKAAEARAAVAHKTEQARTEAGESADTFAAKADATAAELKKKAGVQGDKAKKEAKEAEDWAAKNKGNPVVLGNLVAVAALGGLLGVGAYRKYAAGELTYKVAAAWAGAVGLFAAGDYLVSQWLFKNRYPTKK